VTDRSDIKISTLDVLSLRSASVTHPFDYLAVRSALNIPIRNDIKINNLDVLSALSKRNSPF
jgi:hypothetical protein